MFKEKGGDAQRELEGLAEDLLRAQGDIGFDTGAANNLRRLVVNSPEAYSLNAGARSQVLASVNAYGETAWRRDFETAKCRADADEELRKFCGAKAAGLMYATAKLHAELGQLIADNPSPRQRERRTRLAYRRFMDLVGVFVGLRGAF